MIAIQKRLQLTDVDTEGTELDISDVSGFGGAGGDEQSVHELHWDVGGAEVDGLRFGGEVDDDEDALGAGGANPAEDVGVCFVEHDVVAVGDRVVVLLQADEFLVPVEE